MNEVGGAEARYREQRDEAVFTRIEDAPSAEQRREHARFCVDLDVSLGSDHNFYAGFVENLSAGGVFVATHMLKPVGEVVELTIYLPEQPDPIRGRGEVRWIREFNERSNVPPGMGIRFVELEPGSHTAIESFLRQREPLFFDDE